jgi:glycosyltransferase involved in cell wall biosynthesis
MRQLILDNKVINDDSVPFVIAEIGHNHQGNLENAIKLIHAASAAGASAAKFQKRENKKLFTPDLYNQKYNSENAFGETYGEHREALEFGINEYKDWELILGIKNNDVNVKLMGVIDSSELVKNLLDADIYIHTSYIDNSPNSICEAQLIGIPIISTDVGGISSLIIDGITGHLVPSNDPFSLVSKILKIFNDSDNTKLISNQGKIIAFKRHNKEAIKDDLFNCYNKIIYA